MAPTFLWNGVERPETDVTFKEKKRRGDEDIGVQINDRFGKVVNDLGNQADLIKTYNRLFCANCVARLAVIYGVGVRSLFCSVQGFCFFTFLSIHMSIKSEQSV